MAAPTHAYVCACTFRCPCECARFSLPFCTRKAHRHAGTSLSALCQANRFEGSRNQMLGCPLPKRKLLKMTSVAQNELETQWTPLSRAALQRRRQSYLIRWCKGGCVLCCTLLSVSSVYLNSSSHYCIISPKTITAIYLRLDFSSALIRISHIMMW